MATFSPAGMTAAQIKEAVENGTYSWDDIYQGFLDWYGQAIADPDVAAQKALALTEGTVGPKPAAGGGAGKPLGSPPVATGPDVREDDTATFPETEPPSPPAFAGAGLPPVSPSGKAPAASLAKTGPLEAPALTAPFTPQTDNPQLDDFTRYLQRFGLAGKTQYNPAEQYQAGLFNPLRNIYDVGQGLFARLGGGQTPGTFQEFLERGGDPTTRAQDVLRSVYGFTPDTKRSVGDLGLGYEPGQFEFGEEGEDTGGLNRGKLGELQSLLRYGLRPTTGTYGAKYISGVLPQLQQAYYGQRNTPGAIGAPGPQGTNFLDWLKSRYNLSF